MLNCEIEMTRPEPEDPAPVPAAGEARIECQRPIDQPDHGIDVLAEISERVGGMHQDDRVIAAHLQRPAREFDSFASDSLRRVGPAVIDRPQWQIAAHESAGP